MREWWRGSIRSATHRVARFARLVEHTHYEDHGPEVDLARLPLFVQVAPLDESAPHVLQRVSILSQGLDAALRCTFREMLYKGCMCFNWQTVKQLKKVMSSQNGIVELRKCLEVQLNSERTVHNKRSRAQTIAGHTGKVTFVKVGCGSCKREGLAEHALNQCRLLVEALILQQLDCLILVALVIAGDWDLANERAI